jgi:hypothetical protein
MKMAKRFVTAALMVMFLGSLAGCIIVDRGGHRRYYSGYGHDYRDRGWDRR